jgi:hypothetical protein
MLCSLAFCSPSYSASGYGDEFNSEWGRLGNRDKHMTSEFTAANVQVTRLGSTMYEPFFGGRRGGVIFPIGRRGPSAILIRDGGREVTSAVVQLFHGSCTVVICYPL